MKPQIILLALTSVVLINSPGHASLLADSEFAGSSAAARAAVTTKDASLTASSFNFASSFNDALTASRVGFITATNLFARANATTSSTPAGPISAGEFVSVTITPGSGKPLNLSSLSIDLGYSLDGATVPGAVGTNLGASVFLSVDGFTADKAVGTKTFIGANQGATGYFWENLTIDLSRSALAV